MMQFICYVFPAILAVWITEAIRKDKYEIKEWIYHFCLYVMGINYSISFLLTTLFTGSSTYLSMAHFNHSLIVKYLSIAIVLAVFLPIVFTIIKHNFKFELVVENLNNKDVRKNKNEKKIKEKKRSKGKIKK